MLAAAWYSRRYYWFGRSTTSEKKAELEVEVFVAVESVVMRMFVRMIKLERPRGRRVHVVLEIPEDAEPFAF